MPIPVEPDDERVRRLLAEDPIGNLVIEGDLAVHSPGEVRLHLDDPDDPAAIVAQSWWIRIYARDRAALGRLLPAIPEAQEEFEGHREAIFGGVAGWIQEVLAEQREIVWENPCWLYHLDPVDLDPSPIAHPVRPLGTEHAPLVAEHWEHGDSIEYVGSRIEDGPTVAVFEDGAAVSWALTHADGQMGMMFTLPEWRGRGFARSLTVALSREVIAAGRTPYLYSVQKNEPAWRLAENCGFRRWGDYRWFGTRSRSRAEED